MASKVTNETLAALMRSNHEETSKRLDSIDARVAETNGRLRKAETSIAVLESARNTQSVVTTSTTVDPKVNVVNVTVGIAFLGAVVLAAFKGLGVFIAGAMQVWKALGR